MRTPVIRNDEQRRFSDAGYCFNLFYALRFLINSFDNGNKYNIKNRYKFFIPVTRIILKTNQNRYKI